MKKSVYKRLNITLPESTVALLEAIVDKGSRSGFIDDAIKLHAHNQKRKTLEQRLKEGAIARAERNLKMAEEWFHVDEELWPE